MSGLSRDGGELDRPGAAEGAQDPDRAAPCRCPGPDVVSASARDGRPNGARGEERARRGGGGRRSGLSEGAGDDDRAVGAGRGGGGGGDGDGRAARDRAGATVGDRARLQPAGPERAAGDRAAAGAGAVGRRGDRGDGGDAGRGGGGAAAVWGEGDPEQGRRDAGGGGGVGDGVEAAAGEGGVIGLLAYLVVLAASAERAAGEPHRATPKKGPLVTA